MRLIYLLMALAAYAVVSEMDYRDALLAHQGQPAAYSAALAAP